MTEENHWHLDKRVPIALIFAILIQTAGAFWWASDITSRVANLEHRADSNKMLVERVIRLEEQVKYSNKLLEEIKNELRKR